MSVKILDYADVYCFFQVSSRRERKVKIDSIQDKVAHIISTLEDLQEMAPKFF